MDAGRLTSKLTLKQKTVTRDSAGGEVVTYVTRATVAGAAEPLRGREYIALQQSQSDLSVRFTIYFREDVGADWRVGWRGREYEIDGEPIDVDGRRNWLEIMCRSAQT